MRILITTKQALRHQILLSLLARQFPQHIVGVCFQAQQKSGQERGSARSLGAKIATWFQKKLLGKGLVGISRGFKAYPATLSYQKYLHSLYSNMPTDEWRLHGIEERYDVDPNSESTQNWVVEKKPDLIVVFGGKILKGAWLTAAKFGTINLHYGILPAYRGGKSTEFALYHGDLHEIGASLHYVDSGIDTGPLISKHYVSPLGITSIDALLAKVYQAGFDGLLAEIERLVKTRSRRLLGSNEATQYICLQSRNYKAKDFNSKVQARAEQRLTLINSLEWPYYSRLYSLHSTPNQAVFEKKKRLPKKLGNGVYIILFHTIFDPDDHTNWESSYNKVATPIDFFEEHIDYLSNNADAVRLEEIPALFRSGDVDRPLFCITFDDAYLSCLTKAAPVLEKHNIQPTLFVNSNFSFGDEVYYRVKEQMLISHGFRESLVRCYRQMRGYSLPETVNLRALSKKFYEYGQTEQVIEECWNRNQMPELARVHLNAEDLTQLERRGWSVGVHTKSHPNLCNLTVEQHEYEIVGCYNDLEARGLRPIKWLSYPHGGLSHVSQSTKQWIDSNLEWNAVFALGGINRLANRTEWMRIPIGGESLANFQAKLKSDSMIVEQMVP